MCFSLFVSPLFFVQVTKRWQQCQAKEEELHSREARLASQEEDMDKRETRIVSSEKDLQERLRLLQQAESSNREDLRRVEETRKELENLRQKACWVFLLDLVGEGEREN